MKKIPVMFVAGSMAFMLSSCGPVKNSGEVRTDIVNNIPQSSKEADGTRSGGKEDTAYDVLNHLMGEYDYTSDDGNDHSVSTADEKFIDYEALEIKEYEYPVEFSMGDNLKTAIAQLASGYMSFDSNTARIGDWKQYFIANFIQNSRLTFDYLDLISDKNNGQISIDELNYIQYSLTNTELDLSSDINGSIIDRYEAASPVYSGSIVRYSYEDTDSGVLITADLEVRYDGTEEVQKYEVTAELIRNPYSCFDGYSIVALSSTVADNLQGDTNPSANEVKTD